MDTNMHSPHTTETSERDAKVRSRRYVTVDLSHHPLNEGKPYHCWDCGYIIATIHNEPMGVAEIKIAQSDAEEKIVGNLCRKCNIMYFFV